MRPIDPETLAEAWRLQREGIAATNAGRPAFGAAQLREGLGLLGWEDGVRRHGDVANASIAARLIISLAYAEALLGNSIYGLRLLDSAADWVAEEDEGILLQQRAVIYRLGGRRREALECLAEAEPLLERHGHLLVLCQLLLNRSAAFGDDGRFSYALRDLNRCYELAKDRGWWLEAAKAIHARGMVERLVGDVPAALHSFAGAQLLYERHAPDAVPSLLGAIGLVLHDVGMFHEARLRFDRAIDELRERRLFHSMAWQEAHRALVSLEMGDLSVAIERAREAEDRARRQDDLTLAGFAEVIRRQAEFRSGNFSDDFADECVAFAERHQDFEEPGQSELAMLLAARARMASGKLHLAEDVLRLRSRQRSSDPLSVRLIRRLAYAELAAARGDRSRALSEIRRGLSVLQDYRSRLGSVEFQVGMTSAGRELADAGLTFAFDSSRPSILFQWSERARAQAFRLPSVIPPRDSDTADLLARLRQLRDEARKASLKGEPVAEINARCKVLERRLREISWRADGPGESIPEVRAANVHKRLKSAGARMASFVTHRGELHVLALAEGRTHHVRLGSAAQIVEAARRLVADLDAVMGRQVPERMAQAIRSSIQFQSEQLADALFGDIGHLLGDGDLVIVPTQLLTQLPWGLLPPLRGRPVTVAPSASVWMAAGTRAFADTGKPLLAAGPDLTHADAELTAISAHYPGCTDLRGPAATAAGVLSALDGAPIAHLAAHGHHEPDNVLFSRLDLADGPLMAYDIARLAAPPRHVVLSACDVGRSVVAVGDETLGFTAALLYAGTATVVSGVARVADDISAQVMTDYHAALARGVAPARALAEATAEHELAPFVLFGAG